MTIDLFLRAAVALAYLVSFTQALSCVQVSYEEFTDDCHCHPSTSFAFDVEGKIEVEDNTINLAIVVDGSSSLAQAEFDLQKDFAQSAAASFAEKNLFENGGTASYVQVSDTVVSHGTFTSAEAFDAFVAADQFSAGSGLYVNEGVAKAQELLSASPSAAAAFMIVVVDEDSDPESEADAARAEGTTVFAIGVGDGVSDNTLLAIAGDSANVFSVDDFDALDGALAEIIDSTAGAVPCPSTGVVLTIDFNALVVSAPSPPDSDIADTIVTFNVDDLEGNPTTFEVLLDTCDFAEGDAIVASVAYADDQGNSPDMSAMEGNGVVPGCGSGTYVPASTCSCPTSMINCGCGMVAGGGADDDKHDPVDDIERCNWPGNPRCPGGWLQTYTSSSHHS